ncbi:hypothetical protein MKW92_026067 [Papaver armeniacum]|nr:hypothetical protein MKW92_026067 [Papaver armeniacum]
MRPRPRFRNRRRRNFSIPSQNPQMDSKDALPPPSTASQPPQSTPSQLPQPPPLQSTIPQPTLTPKAEEIHPNPPIQSSTTPLHYQQQSIHNHQSQIKAPPVNNRIRPPPPPQQQPQSHFPSTTTTVTPTTNPNPNTVTSTPHLQRGGGAISAPAHPTRQPSHFSYFGPSSHTTQFSRNSANVPETLDPNQMILICHPADQNIGMMGPGVVSSSMRPPAPASNQSQSAFQKYQGHEQPHVIQRVGSTSSPSPSSPAGMQRQLTQQWVTSTGPGRPLHSPASTSPSYRQQIRPPTLSQKSHIHQQHPHTYPTVSHQMPPAPQQQQQQRQPNQSQEHYSQQFPPTWVQQPTPLPAALSGLASGNLTTSSTSPLRVNNNNSTFIADSGKTSNQIVSKRGIHELITQKQMEALENKQSQHTSENSSTRQNDAIVQLKGHDCTSPVSSSKKMKMSAEASGSREIKAVSENNPEHLPLSRSNSIPTSHVPLIQECVTGDDKDNMQAESDESLEDFGCVGETVEAARTTVSAQPVEAAETATSAKYLSADSNLEAISTPKDISAPFVGSTLVSVRGSDEEFEFVDNFKIPKKYAVLYKKIFDKYGHMATKKVIKSNDTVLVAFVTSLLKIISTMETVRGADLSDALLERWEGDIEDVENLGFNIKWLRKQFNEVKNNWKSSSGIRKEVEIDENELDAMQVKTYWLLLRKEELQRETSKVITQIIEAEAKISSKKKTIQEKLAPKDNFLNEPVLGKVLS